MSYEPKRGELPSPGDQALVDELRNELRKVQANWEEAVARVASRPGRASDRSVRAPSTQGSQREGTSRGMAGIPAAVAGVGAPCANTAHRASGPRLIVAVHQAFFGTTIPIVAVHQAFFRTTIPNARLTSLRRDDQHAGAFASHPGGGEGKRHNARTISALITKSTSGTIVFDVLPAAIQGGKVHPRRHWSRLRRTGRLLDRVAPNSIDCLLRRIS